MTRITIALFTLASLASLASAEPPAPKDPPAKRGTGLTPKQIREGVDKVLPDIKACGAKAPAVKGLVKLKMRINPRGEIEVLEVVQTPDAGLGACAATAMRKATFAESEAGATVSYPLHF